MLWLICNPNIFLSLSRPSPVSTSHWCVWQRTQGRCLTESWMLFSCHTFPKRLAAAPIVAAEGGLLSWFFRPPAAALASDGFTERECGPNNGRHHDVMLLMWAKNLRQIYDRIPSHKDPQERMHSLKSVTIQLITVSQLRMFSSQISFESGQRTLFS